MNSELKQKLKSQETNEEDKEIEEKRRLDNFKDVLKKCSELIYLIATYQVTDINTDDFELESEFNSLKKQFLSKKRDLFLQIFVSNFASIDNFFHNMQIVYYEYFNYFRLDSRLLSQENVKKYDRLFTKLKKAKQDIYGIDLFRIFKFNPKKQELFFKRKDENSDYLSQKSYSNFNEFETILQKDIIKNFSLNFNDVLNILEEFNFIFKNFFYREVSSNKLKNNKCLITDLFLKASHYRNHFIKTKFWNQNIEINKNEEKEIINNGSAFLELLYFTNTLSSVNDLKNRLSSIEMTINKLDNLP